MEAFYERVAEDRFVATEHTRGPWQADAQHAGPPTALVGRVVEARPGLRVARVTVEFRRPVLIGALTARHSALRSDVDTELVEVSLTPDDGEPALRARVLLVRVDDSLPSVAEATTIPGPEEAEPKPFFPVPYDLGYHAAMDWRFASGSFREPGPAVCWLRMRIPLVAGEAPSPLVRLLNAADCGNGISGVFDWRTHRFINPDLTVHLHRHPTGEWIGLDARTSVHDGIGLADTALHDTTGFVGRGVQSLVVTYRGGVPK